MQETPDRSTHILHVQEKRIVTPNTAELVVCHSGIPSQLESIRQLSLLLHGEQDITLNTKHQSGNIFQPLQTLCQVGKVRGFGSRDKSCELFLRFLFQLFLFFWRIMVMSFGGTAGRTARDGNRVVGVRKRRLVGVGVVESFGERGEGWTCHVK